MDELVSRSPLDDTALVTWLRLEDPRAMDELVRRYRRRIFRQALRYVGSPACADDVTQEVLVKVWRHARTFGGECHLWSWISRITANTSLSYLRARRRRRRFSHELVVGGTGDPVMSPEPEDPSASADELFYRGQRRVHVESAVNALPGVYRRAVVLRDLEDYSTAEAALSLRVPAATVKSRLHRGRRLLSRSLRSFRSDICLQAD